MGGNYQASRENVDIQAAILRPAPREGAMSSLFEAAGMDADTPRPLADRLRPQSLEDVAGQDHLVGPSGTLTRMTDAGQLGSIIFWGPPGTGKTTIAKLLASKTELEFVQMSAIFSGVADLKKAFETARQRRISGKGTLLFVDEIHRFNRAQQDGFLPYLEDGTITLVGATTENPSFELNPAVLSRAQVLTLKRLDEEALETLLLRAEAHMGRDLLLAENARLTLHQMADGDGRYLLNMAEEIFASQAQNGEVMDNAGLGALLQRRVPLYDKGQDGHFNLISALHKSVRGSDPDAALYWLARMLVAGEDPLYLGRRLVRMAVEDIGLADPQALVQANAAVEAFQMLGTPEGELALAQACLYLATAPKSNAQYTAFKSAMKTARDTGSISPPNRILNAPTNLMKDEGYGSGYEYDHDQPDAFSGQDYFPETMGRKVFYDPPERGFEREISKRLRFWSKLREERNQ
jgi:putative ATPase